MKAIIGEESFVDVILPNYNKAEFLEEAINSVITQTYKRHFNHLTCIITISYRRV